MPLKKPKRLGFFAMLLALLGLGGCQDLQEEEEMRLMYGTPAVHYSVKGKVTDDTGKPVKGIEVSLSGNYVDNGQVFSRPFSGDVKSYSDDSGAFLDNHSAIFSFQSLTIHFKDVDGDANGGTFADDSTTVDVVIKDVTNGGAWFRGQADVEIPAVKLKKK
jgi:putative lipoprotein (rSAM/lipoprotein system)